LGTAARLISSGPPGATESRSTLLEALTETTFCESRERARMSPEPLDLRTP
jgi:hypothetical protein